MLSVLSTPDPETWGADAITVPGSASVRVIHWPSGRFVVVSGADEGECYREAVAALRGLVGAHPPNRFRNTVTFPV